MHVDVAAVARSDEDYAGGVPESFRPHSGAEGLAYCVACVVIEGNEFVTAWHGGIVARV
ncbi:hypothetical protein ACFORO_45355 [Amycolatopsis halotolerans]|uniref:Uncharacterized protein n=1 Tax=Amycolatopsis halotolerans TaxID=330083 RepID=A0ABV7QWM3_9PSEU